MCFLWLSVLMAFQANSLEPPLLPEDHLTLAQVYENLDARYPLILKAQQMIEFQQGQVLSAFNPFDPQLQALVQSISGYPQLNYGALKIQGQTPNTPLKYELTLDRVQNGFFPSYQGEFNTGQDGRLKGKITLPLWRDLWIDSARSQLKQQQLRLEAIEQAWHQTRWQVRWQALQAYWRWFTASQQYRVFRRWLDLAIMNQNILEKSVKLAQNAPIDLVENQKNIAQRRGQLWASFWQLEQARWQLAFFRLDSDQKPQPPGIAASQVILRLIPLKAPPELDVEKTLARIPALKQLQKEIEALEVQAQWAKWQRYPRIDVSTQWTQNWGALPPGMGAAQQQWFGVEISFPLLNRWGKGQAQQWQAQLLAQRWEYQHQRNQWKIQLEQMVSNLKTLYQQLQQATLEVQTTLQLQEAEERKLKAGSSSVFLVNIREQEAALAQVKWWDLWAQYQTLIGVMELVENWLLP